MKTVKIAVIMTVYNRKETTISCLEKLIKQARQLDVNLVVYLVDDGQDGTGIETLTRFPGYISIIKGTGGLFWCGGMRVSFSAAMNDGYDYYLWLNDDTMLYPDALDKLLNTYVMLKLQNGAPAIVTGSLQDPINGELTYGGSNIVLRYWSPLRLTPIVPNDSPKKCNIFNGNLVLIPHEIAAMVGNLKNDYTHASGDYDYGLRAQAHGFSCWVAPGYFGTCVRMNAGEVNSASFSDDIKEALSILRSEAWVYRVRDWMKFAWKYGGIWGPIYWLLGTIYLRYPKVWLASHTKKR